MPNYCNNNLFIEGNPDTLKKIMSYVESNDNVFDFERIVPMPDSIYRGNIGQKEEEIYGKSNRYDWSIENWGTKWNSVDAEKYENSFEFLTAWSPCDPVIAALAAKFPSMRFTYTFYETGMCFCGESVYENGELIFYYDGDYAENPACEDDEWADDYALANSLFPIKESGFTESVEIVEKNGGIVRGRLHYREYENNRIYRMSDGFFVATDGYAKKYTNEQNNTIRRAA